MPKREQYKPWYLNLNPEVDFPTMLVKNNIPVIGTIEIIEHMEERLDGINILINCQPKLIKARFEEFKVLHEAFDVVEFTQRVI